MTLRCWPGCLAIIVWSEPAPCPLCGGSVTNDALGLTVQTDQYFPDEDRWSIVAPPTVTLFGCCLDGRKALMTHAADKALRPISPRGAARQIDRPTEEALHA